MDVVVFGKHVEIDAELRALTKEKLERIAKYANDVRRIDVDFDEHKTRRVEDSHTCEILVHVNHHLVKGSACAAEHPIALDLALDKVEHQMRRLHERRVDRRNGARDRAVKAAPAAAAAEPEEAETPIVKTKRFAVKPMTIDEAALQMDLLEHDFFVFRSAQSGNASVMYRRKDGALGVIEVTG